MTKRSGPIWNRFPRKSCGGHTSAARKLVVFARNRIKAQMKRRRTCHSELNREEEVLDADVLTIGFARRFASYKRGDLILRDADRPIQLVFAGKAHPKDTEGKDIIRNIVRFAERDEIRRRVVFLEDYDIEVVRVLVRGVEAWRRGGVSVRILPRHLDLAHPHEMGLILWEDKA